MSKANPEWKVATLGHYVDIQTGYPFKSTEYESCGIKLLRGDNIIQGRLRWDGVKRWPEDHINDLEKYFLRAGDVVLAMDRPWIEAGLKYACIMEYDLPCLLVQRVARIRGINGLLTDYVRFVIGHHSFTDYVKGIWTGVAVPHISESQIRAFKFRLPPTGLQKRIVSTLSAYDDLIDNNTQRITILERMARMIYREWFVNFRFPGHEKVRTTDSEMGPIPQGWRVSKVSSLVETQYGYTESATDKAVGPKYLRGMDINKRSFIQWDAVPYCPILAADLNTYRLRLGDIVVIRMADPGKVGIVEKEVEAVFASYLIRLKISHKDLTPYYLFYFLLSDRYQDYVSGASTGTTRKSASAGVITDIDIVVPSPGMSAKFEAIVGNLRKMLNNLLDRNHVLRQTRDLLLPKLISGEVSVEQLEAENVAQGV